VIAMFLSTAKKGETVIMLTMSHKENQVELTPGQVAVGENQRPLVVTKKGHFSSFKFPGKSKV